MSTVDKLKNETETDSNTVLGTGVVISWWSGGITSAVACRLALEKYNIE